MTQLFKIIKANWTLIAVVLSVISMFESSRAQLAEHEARLSTIEATKPELMRDQLNVALNDVAAIRSSVEATREDVAFIRGTLEHR